MSQYIAYQISAWKHQIVAQQLPFTDFEGRHDLLEVFLIGFSLLCQQIQILKECSWPITMAQDINSNRSACVVFAKWPELGRVKTRLAADTGPEFATEFYRLCCMSLISEISRWALSFILHGLCIVCMLFGRWKGTSRVNLAQKL